MSKLVFAHASLNRGSSVVTSVSMVIFTIIVLTFGEKFRGLVVKVEVSCPKGYEFGSLSICRIIL